MDYKFFILEDGVYFVPASAKFKILEEEYHQHISDEELDPDDRTENGPDGNSRELEDAMVALGNPKTVFVASAYETGTTILLDTKPIPISEFHGNRFNYGSTNLVKVDQPGFILIIAEND